MSINALACQTDIAQRIAEEGGWYLLAVKDNQSDLQPACSATSPARTALAPWPTTGARPWTVDTDASSGVPARSWAVPAASGTNSIRTAVGRTWVVSCAWSPHASCAATPHSPVRHSSRTPRSGGHQTAVQPGQDDVRTGHAPVRVERGAHCLAVDGAGLQPPDQPHHQGLQLREQICVPVPPQAPQGLGAGDAVLQDPQPAQPDRRVPCKVGRVLRALAVTDAGQGMDRPRRSRWSGMASRSATSRRTVGYRREVERCDHGGHEGCDASLCGSTYS